MHKFYWIIIGIKIMFKFQESKIIYFKFQSLNLIYISWSSRTIWIAKDSYVALMFWSFFFVISRYNPYNQYNEIYPF